MKFKFRGISDNILQGLFEVSEVSGFKISEDGFLVNVVIADENNIKIIKTFEKADVYIPEESLIFRSVMHILSKNENEYTYSEPVVFKDRGAMFDMAQGNAALKVDSCKELLTDDSLAVLINSYTAGVSPAVMSYILNSTVSKRFGGKAFADEIGLPVTQSGLVLPCGSTAVWTK